MTTGWTLERMWHTWGPCVILQQDVLAVTCWSKRDTKTVLRGLWQSETEITALQCHIPARMPLRLAVGSLPGILSEVWMYIIFRAALAAYLPAQAVSSFPVFSFLIALVQKESCRVSPTMILMLLTIDAYGICSRISNRLRAGFWISGWVMGFYPGIQKAPQVLCDVLWL